VEELKAFVRFLPLGQQPYLMMKKIYLLILFFCAFKAYSQEMSADYYVGIGERFLGRRQIDSAIFYWKYVLEHFPNKNRECSQAMIRIAGAYERDSAGMAIKWYLKIIGSEKINDQDKGMELMEPYANYRHNSCMRLAALYARRKQYDEALMWVNAAVTQYRYITYVGTAFETKMVNIALVRSDYYKQLEFKDSAIYALVHKILDTNIRYRLPEMDEKNNNDVDYYGKIAVTAGKLIEEVHGKDEFRYRFNKALKKLKLKKDKKHKWRIAKFKLYGIEYKITSTNYKKKKKAFINEFRQSKLYMELEK
jgi:tetratricopeptide (TPR) repeat protein